MAEVRTSATASQGDASRGRGKRESQRPIRCLPRDMHRFYINRDHSSGASSLLDLDYGRVWRSITCFKTTMPPNEVTALLQPPSTTANASRWCWYRRGSCPSEWRSEWRLITLLLLGLSLWAVAWSICGHVAVPMKGQLFCLGLLWALSYIAGWLVGLMKLPPLLGMLLTGVLLRNMEVVEFTGQFVTLKSILRMLALVIISIRAGLGLDLEALQRKNLLVVRLAMIPSLVEMVTTAFMTHYLFGLPWFWSFLLGPVLAVSSPEVVTPCVSSLQSRGYGVGKGISTLVRTATSLDEILGTTTCQILLSIIFSTDDLLSKILEGPFSIAYGFIFGVVWGSLLRYFPAKNDPYCTSLRTVVLGAGGVMAVFASHSVGYDGAGPLGCGVAAFVANQGWRKQGWTERYNPVATNYAVLWSIFEPILFGLAGTEIYLDALKLHHVAFSMACLSLALGVRLMASFLIAFGGGLNWKERIFVALAWLPKATVQAAVAPLVVDAVRHRHSHEDQSSAHFVLLVAVMAILLTAPLGAVLLTVLGPQLLANENAETQAPTEAHRQIIVNDGFGV